MIKQYTNRIKSNNGSIFFKSLHFFKICGVIHFNQFLEQLVITLIGMSFQNLLINSSRVIFLLVHKNCLLILQNLIKFWFDGI